MVDRVEITFEIDVDDPGEALLEQSVHLAERVLGPQPPPEAETGREKIPTVCACRRTWAGLLARKPQRNSVVQFARNYGFWWPALGSEKIPIHHHASRIWASLTAPQSQNPQRSSATPVVLPICHGSTGEPHCSVSRLYCLSENARYISSIEIIHENASSGPGAIPDRR